LKFKLWIILLILANLSVLAQKATSDNVCIYIAIPHQKNAAFLSKNISVHKYTNDTIYAFLSTHTLNWINNQNIPYIIIHDNRFKNKQDYNYQFYPKFSEYKSSMQMYADSFPHLCKYIQFGESILKFDLLCLHLGNHLNPDPLKPSILFTSSMHGNELSCYMGMLKLIDYLITNYGKNAYITDLMNKVNIYINPISNPDGAYFGSDSIYRTSRFNSLGIDLNRNFPDPVYGENPDGFTLQLENKYMMEFMKSIPFVFAINLHAGAEVINYPWDAFMPEEFDTPHPDDTWYENISKDYIAQLNKQNDSFYFTGISSTGYTRGHLWYPLFGGRQDYVNYFLHRKEITLEISQEFIPDSNNLEYLWNANKDAYLSLIEQMLYGLRIKLSDSISKKYIPAFIGIKNIDKPTTYYVRDSFYGVFHHLPAPGIYHLEISSPGYKDTIIKNITVNHNMLNHIDIALKPIQNGIIVYPTVCSEFINVWSDQIITNIQIYDLSGKIILDSKPASNQTRMNIIKMNQGMYILKIQTNYSEKYTKIFKYN